MDWLGGGGTSWRRREKVTHSAYTPYDDPSRGGIS